jgi:hypothetical protein
LPRFVEPDAKTALFRELQYLLCCYDNNHEQYQAMEIIFLDSLHTLEPDEVRFLLD